MHRGSKTLSDRMYPDLHTATQSEASDQVFLEE
jgi:hypothetical protein